MRHSLLVGTVLALVSSAPGTAQIVINEVLPAPGTDWTNNGIYSSAEDEWLELVNPTTLASNRFTPGIM